MLIVQSSLIRTNRRDIHRQVGKLSYLLAPLIVVSVLLLANHKLNVRGLTADGVYILSLQVFLLIQFVVPYTLAMKNRVPPGRVRPKMYGAIAEGSNLGEPVARHARRWSGIRFFVRNVLIGSGSISRLAVCSWRESIPGS